MIDVLNGHQNVNDTEIKTSIQLQNFRLGLLKEDDFGIFSAVLRYNGRNDVYELKLKSIKRIPIELIQQIK